MKKRGATDIWVLNSHHWRDFLRQLTLGNHSGSTTTTPKPSFLGVADAMAAHVEETISRLQWGTFLLRNELSYAMAEARKVKRIGWLYEDRILVKGAEVERQGLVGRMWPW